MIKLKFTKHTIDDTDISYDVEVVMGADFPIPFLPVGVVTKGMTGQWNYYSSPSNTGTLVGLSHQHLTEIAQHIKNLETSEKLLNSLDTPDDNSYTGLGDQAHHSAYDPDMD